MPQGRALPTGSAEHKTSQHHGWALTELVKERTEEGVGGRESLLEGESCTEFL